MLVILRLAFAAAPAADAGQAVAMKITAAAARPTKAVDMARRQARTRAFIPVLLVRSELAGGGGGDGLLGEGYQRKKRDVVF